MPSAGPNPSVPDAPDPSVQSAVPTPPHTPVQDQDLAQPPQKTSPALPHDDFPQLAPTDHHHDHDPDPDPDQENDHDQENDQEEDQHEEEEDDPDQPDAPAQIPDPPTAPDLLPTAQQTPVSQPQRPAPDPPAAPSSPTTLPPPPPPPTRRPANRRTARNSRLGRPPNINENSLMRRLECVMAVDSGRMTMLTACQQYDISARTFYRWLRNKDRLIELTGFTEDDFRNNPPWAPAPDPNAALPQAADARQPPTTAAQDQIDPAHNLPRLPPQPGSKQLPTATSAPPASAGPSTAFMGMKRRFPKSTEPVAPRTVPYAGSGPASADDRFQSPGAQAAFYARRAFTKMPSQTTVPSGDPISAERQAARASTRMRPKDWPVPDAANASRFADDRRFAAQQQAFRPPAGARSRSASPGEPIKRRKVMRGEVEEGAATEEGGSAGATPPANREGGAPPESPEMGADYANGAGSGTAFPSSEGGKGQVNGNADGVGKHRIEIMMGRRKVTIAWYHGASAEDIKTSIARRFALLPGTQWALIDRNFDEIVISSGVPSGRYTLTVFS